MAKMDKYNPTPTRRIKNGWSFSRYSVYKTCPAQAAYKFIDKLPEPPAVALDRGSLIHKQAECFIKGQAAPVLPPDENDPIPKLNKDGSLPPGAALHKAGVLPPTLKKIATILKEAAANFKKRLKAQAVEDTWAFTREWKLCSPTDWDNCWVRIKVDYAREVAGDTLIIRDWKTGKFHADLHADYLETLQLYALGGLLKYPHIKRVKPFLNYVDLGKEYPGPDDGELVYARADVPELKKLWTSRAEPIFKDTVFAPRPGPKCKWCAFSASKGGPCKF